MEISPSVFLISLLFVYEKYKDNSNDRLIKSDNMEECYEQQNRTIN